MPGCGLVGYLIPIGDEEQQWEVFPVGAAVLQVLGVILKCWPGLPVPHAS